MPGEGLTHGPPANRKAGGSHHRFSQVIRHSLRNGFNGVLRALPGDRAFLPPSLARLSCELGISVGMPEPHDFAVRVSHVRLTSPQRPSHSASRSVTIGHNALCIEAGCANHTSVLRKLSRGLFFLEGLDRQPRRSSDLPVGSSDIVCAAHRTIWRSGHVGFSSDRHSQKQTT
jgi:hypothetical protein